MTVLAGGVGAARFLTGLCTLGHDVTVVGNTGDDITLWGLRVCPDLDTVIYTLGGGISAERGWGREDESFRVKDEFFYRLKFVRPEGSVKQALTAKIDGTAETVAWTWERPDRGRSFGFSGLHFHDNWKMPEYRRLVGQAVLWTLGVSIPETGLQVE